MAKIEGSIDYVLENEGGFTIDDGGPTMWGITIPDVAQYRKVPESSITIEDMKNLPKMEACEIYRELYWQKLSLDQVAAQNVATAIFDIGVNRGVSTSAKYAQRACKTLGLSVAVDGVMGPNTIAAVNMAKPSQMVRTLEGLDMAGYLAIVAIDPEKYGRYLKGWEARAQRLLTLV